MLIESGFACLTVTIQSIFSFCPSSELSISNLTIDVKCNQVISCYFNSFIVYILCIMVRCRCLTFIIIPLLPTNISNSILFYGITFTQQRIPGKYFSVKIFLPKRHESCYNIYHTLISITQLGVLMKKSKLTCILLVTAVLCFSFTGCSRNSGE